ncbi:hypothetical protein [Erwinia amylovora]
MCIRDRVIRGGLSDGSTETKKEPYGSFFVSVLPSLSPPPVSYTHLDVYKRQNAN